jgi:hypothetical protein
MISLKLRRIFYSAGIAVEHFNTKRKRKLEKIIDLEKHVLIAKKIMHSLEEKKEGDPAVLIRLEGRLKKIDKIIFTMKQI